MVCIIVSIWLNCDSSLFAADVVEKIKPSIIKICTICCCCHKKMILVIEENIAVKVHTHTAAAYSFISSDTHPLSVHTVRTL
jgi:hypothetical protein